MTEEAKPSDCHINSLGHIDVTVSEHEEDRHRALGAIEFCLSQIKVQVGERASSHRPPPQPQPAASDDMTEEGGRHSSRFASRAARCPRPGLWQASLNASQLVADPGAVGELDPLGELL